MANPKIKLEITDAGKVFTREIEIDASLLESLSSIGTISVQVFLLNTTEDLARELIEDYLEPLHKQDARERLALHTSKGMQAFINQQLSKETTERLTANIDTSDK